MLVTVEAAAPGKVAAGLRKGTEGGGVAVMDMVVVVVVCGGGVGVGVVGGKSRKKACRKASLADSLDNWS